MVTSFTNKPPIRPHLWCFPYHFPRENWHHKNVIYHILPELRYGFILNHVINGLIKYLRTETFLMWNIEEVFINLCKEEKVVARFTVSEVETTNSDIFFLFSPLSIRRSIYWYQWGIWRPHYPYLCPLINVC